MDDTTIARSSSASLRRRSSRVLLVLELSSCNSQSAVRNPQSQKAFRPQLLHRVALMVILGAAGALTRARGFQFSDDGVNGVCVARDGFANWTAAERAIALAIFRKIHFWNGNVFALDVAPNVNLGPIQQRLH